MLGCDGVDGAFQNITDNNGKILDKVLNYRDVLNTLFNIQLTIPDHYLIHKGKYDVKYSLPNSDMAILNSDNLFSYAFIFGPKPKYANFSFTMDMAD